MESPPEDIQDQQGAVIVVGDRYCKGCLYCLGDLGDPGAPTVCPECGRAIDKADPKATLPGPKRRRPFLLRWPVLSLIAVMGVVLLARGGLLPMPESGGGGTLWEWRHHRYGYGEGLWWWVGDAYGTRTEHRNGLEIVLTLQNGIASRIVATATDDGHPVFEVERHGDPPVWSLRVDDHALAWPHNGNPELIRAINHTREFRFGVTIYPPADTQRLTPAGPIVASGTEADILWAYYKAYGLQVDLPERVPHASDGWHPMLGPDAAVEYPRKQGANGVFRFRSYYRGR